MTTSFFNLRKFILGFAAIYCLQAGSGFAYALPKEEGEAHEWANQAPEANSPDAEPIADDAPHHTVLHKVLLYIPNRVVDLFDIFRVRLRIGPGVAADVRATKYASAFVGTYASTYLGLPGPRMRRIPKSPVGFETLNGAQLSVLDATAGFDLGPEYSPTEFGAGLQLGIIGFDIGIDPVEIADFVAGFVTVDVRHDDF